MIRSSQPPTKGLKSATAGVLQCPCCGYDNALELKDDEAKRGACNQTWKCVNPRCSSELRGVKLGKAGTVARCELCGKFETIKNVARHRCKGYHVSHDLQLLIDHGDVDALAALSDHTGRHRRVGRRIPARLRKRHKRRRRYLFIAAPPPPFF